MSAGQDAGSTSRLMRAGAGITRLSRSARICATNDLNRTLKQHERSHMNNLALIKTSPESTAIQSMADLQNLGQIFVKSGFFADIKDAAQAIVKVMAGSELGFPPIASMTGVYLFQG